MQIQRTQQYSLLSLQHVSALLCHIQGVLISSFKLPNTIYTNITNVIYHILATFKTWYKNSDDGIVLPKHVEVTKDYTVYVCCVCI
jgi:hypothetical protein